MRHVILERKQNVDISVLDRYLSENVFQMCYRQKRFSFGDESSTCFCEFSGKNCTAHVFSNRFVYEYYCYFLQLKTVRAHL